MSDGDLVCWARELSESDVAPLDLAQAAEDLGVLADCAEWVDDLEEIFESDALRRSYRQLMGGREWSATQFPLPRVIAAAHLQTPETVLRGLAADADAEVLWALASNPSTPPDVLEELYSSGRHLPGVYAGDEMVYFPRWFLPGFEDPSTASTFEDVPVSVAVAANPSTSLTIVDEVVTNGEHLEITALVTHQLERLRPAAWEALASRLLLRDGAESWGTLAITHRTCPIGILKQLTASRHSEFATAVNGVLALRPDAGVDVHDELAHHADPWVRWAVASNPGVGLSVLRQLATDSNPMVRTAVLENPASTDEIKAIVALSQ